MSEVTVRLAELKDAPGIARVHVETWQCAYRGQIPDDYLNSLSVEKRTERWKDILSKPEDNATTLVGEIDGRVVGFCSISHCRDDDMPKDTGELWAIYVAQDFMGRGLGSALLKEGLKRLRDDGYMRATLWVLTSNEKTRRWYESKGWKVEGKLKEEEQNGFMFQETRYIIDLN